eukprot:m.212440 g.212440  ORF g.212440 m.212440 type:complete len:77 (-) comp15566_c0_seq32:152-382(-)
MTRSVVPRQHPGRRSISSNTSGCVESSSWPLSKEMLECSSLSSNMNDPIVEPQWEDVSVASERHPSLHRAGAGCLL